MEGLRKIAIAYYLSGTDEERSLFDKFFQALDNDANGRVSYREFFHFMSLEAHNEYMRTRDFFNQLDIDRRGSLGSRAVATLYYILRSGRPICRQCKTFITKEYFACMRCFNNGSAPYSICLECFGDEGRFNHHHVRSYFVDNFSLLESLRKKNLPNHQSRPGSSGSQVTPRRPPSSSDKSSTRALVPHKPNTAASSPGSSGSQVTIAQSQVTPRRPPSSSENSSTRAIVLYNPNTPAVRMTSWQVALRLLEAGLHFASVLAGCSIM